MVETHTPQPALCGQNVAESSLPAVRKDFAVYPGIIQFPLNGIAGRYAVFPVTVRGNSMSEAGLHDRDCILLQKVELPQNEAIMLIRHNARSTLKRVKIIGERVFLCWEDGSRRQIEVNPADYEFQGKLLAIERKPGKRG